MSMVVASDVSRCNFCKFSDIKICSKVLGKGESIVLPRVSDIVNHAGNIQFDINIDVDISWG